jgi:hypothetical protein
MKTIFPIENNPKIIKNKLLNKNKTKDIQGFKTKYNKNKMICKYRKKKIKKYNIKKFKKN